MMFDPGILSKSLDDPLHSQMAMIYLLFLIKLIFIKSQFILNNIIYDFISITRGVFRDGVERA